MAKKFVSQQVSHWMQYSCTVPRDEFVTPYAFIGSGDMITIERSINEKEIHEHSLDAGISPLECGV
jgi:hypothetical protein